MPASPLAARVAALRLWATSRIEHCRREEMKFAEYCRGRVVARTPHLVVEAATERRTLQAVLALLDDDVQASVTNAEGTA